MFSREYLIHFREQSLQPRPPASSAAQRCSVLPRLCENLSQASLGASDDRDLKNLPAQILAPEINLRNLDRRTALQVFGDRNGYFNQALLVAADVDARMATQLGSLVEANLADRRRSKRIDFKIQNDTRLQTTVTTFLENELGVKGTGAKNLCNRIRKSRLLVVTAVRWCTPPGTPLKGRLVCGDAGRGENFHDDVDKIVATLPFSGPGTQCLAFSAVEQARSVARYHVPVHHRPILAAEKFSATSGHMLLMRGSTLGNSAGKEVPLLSIPGLVHKKPDPETCQNRFAFVVYADYDWRWGRQQYFASVPKS